MEQESYKRDTQHQTSTNDSSQQHSSPSQHHTQPSLTQSLHHNQQTPNTPHVFELDDDSGDDEPDVLVFDHQQAARDLMAIYRQDVANGDSSSTDEFIGILELELNNKQINQKTLEESIQNLQSIITHAKTLQNKLHIQGEKRRAREKETISDVEKLALLVSALESPSRSPPPKKTKHPVIGTPAHQA